MAKGEGPTDHDDELRRTDLADERPEADEQCGGAEVGVDQLDERDLHQVERAVDYHREERLHKDSPLHAEAGDEHGEANSPQPVVLKEGHQVAEADEHHQRHVEVELVETLLRQHLAWTGAHWVTDFLI